jgi:ATP-dependent DNA ligase
MVPSASAPVAPMLAKLRPEIPVGDGWVYEPKWDGFRAIVYKAGDDISVISRDDRPLHRYFPELVDALSGLPGRCVIDGEVAVASSGGFEFDALLQRIHPAESRIKRLARETPAGFIAFDLLGLGATSYMNEPFEHRRETLAEQLQAPPTPTPREIFEVLAEAPSAILLTPQTDDLDVASSWLEAFESEGLDGIVAKRIDDVYVPGKRVMVKVKRARTVECVVGGYRRSKGGDGVGSLLLGLYDDSGALHYVGHTSSFRAQERKELLEELRPLEGGESFGQGRTPGGPSRWTGGRDTSWVPLDPVRVCEVAFDRMMSGRFRHAVRFLRWRPDKPPRECTFDQT